MSKNGKICSFGFGKNYRTETVSVSVSVSAENFGFGRSLHKMHNIIHMCTFPNQDLTACIRSVTSIILSAQKQKRGHLYLSPKKK